MFFRKKIGTDIVETSRFNAFSTNKEDPFLVRTFSAYEINYCFLHKEPATHLAGIFAAKEAVSKALGVTKHPITLIEIRHNQEGMPEAYVSNKKLNVSVSISHTNSIATAVALG